MKRSLGMAGLFWGIFVSAVLTQAAETYTLVRVSNFDGTTSIDALAPVALAELRKDVALENRLIKDAYQNVAQEWKRSRKGKTVKQTINYKDMRREVEVPAPMPPFPLKCPKPRVISQVGTFPTPEAAAEKKRALEAAVKPAVPEKAEEENKDKDDKDKDKEKSKDKGKEKPKAGGKKDAKVEEADVEQLFGDMMAELSKLKEEIASLSKGVKKPAAN
jgi:hypothetical protein